MTDDGFEDYLKDAADREYRPPPATPKDAIWARIEAARRDPARRRTTPVVSLDSRRRWAGPALAAAAILALGIGIGRWLVPEVSGRNEIATAPSPAAAPEAAPADPRAETVTRFYAIDHLRKVEYLLTDYQTGRVSGEFRATSRSLLAETRLLLDSPRLTDPAIRRLLEDLEVLLAQVAQLTPNGPGEERVLIDDNLAERAIRPRLRNAIPAGPTA